MHEDYLRTIDKYRKKLLNINDEDEWNEKFGEMCDYQKRYMKAYLDTYKRKIRCSEQELISKLIEHIIYQSTSGNSIVFVHTKEEAEAVDKIIWKEIGDILLDSPQIYEDNGQWAIDCIFGGAFVPEWDGFSEEWYKINSYY